MIIPNINGTIKLMATKPPTSFKLQTLHDPWHLIGESLSWEPRRWIRATQLRRAGCRAVQGGLSNVTCRL